jgi:predicted house-cleaning noncanonical NTP pyrophosphatase (MazG superfamily)
MKKKELKNKIIELLDKYYSAEDDWEEEVADLVENLSNLVDYNEQIENTTDCFSNNISGSAVIGI